MGAPQEMQWVGQNWRPPIFRDSTGAVSEAVPLQGLTKDHRQLVECTGPNASQGSRHSASSRSRPTTPAARASGGALSTHIRLPHAATSNGERPRGFLAAWSHRTHTIRNFHVSAIAQVAWVLRGRTILSLKRGSRRKMQPQFTLSQWGLGWIRKHVVVEVSAAPLVADGHQDRDIDERTAAKVYMSNPRRLGHNRLSAVRGEFHCCHG